MPAGGVASGSRTTGPLGNSAGTDRAAGPGGVGSTALTTRVRTAEAAILLLSILAIEPVISSRLCSSAAMRPTRRSRSLVKSSILACSARSDTSCRWVASATIRRGGGESSIPERARSMRLLAVGPWAAASSIATANAAQTPQAPVRTRSLSRDCFPTGSRAVRSGGLISILGKSESPNQNIENASRILQVWLVLALLSRPAASSRHR